MITKKRKLNKLKVRRCLIILILIILLITFMIIYNISKSKNKYKILSILMNNEFIELDDDVYIDNDMNIFFSKDDVQNLFDSTIYYNEVEQELITTYNKHVALLKLDEDYAVINDENVELQGKLREIDSKIYLPITDLAVVYDLDITYSQKSNRIIMDSTNDAKTEASVIKKTNVKSSKGLFGKKLEKVIIGDKVTILGEVGKCKKIRTPLGNIGYVKSSKLSESIVIREKNEETLKDIEVYRNYSNISGVYDNFEVDTNKLNVVVPTFFYLEEESSILDKTNISTATYSVYKSWADENSLTILPTLTNNSSVSTELLSYSQRTIAINSLVEKLKKYEYIGVNVEFSSIDDVNSFYRFILELSPRLKSENLLLVVTLNNNLDKNRLKNIADYIIEN